MFAAAGLVVHAAEEPDLRRMPPPDEQADVALVDVIARLQKIVSAREHVALETLMGPSFRVEFDAGKGPTAFRRQWRPESAGSPVWRIMERLLALPGYSYSDSLFAMPYVSARFPFDLDPLRYVVAVKTAVPLLASAGPDAKRVGTLDYSIVPLAEPVQPPLLEPPGAFVELRHPSAGRCFVAAADVYFPVAHRAFFEKRGGRWRWISLAAPTLKDPPELRHHKPAGV